MDQKRHRPIESENPVNESTDDGGDTGDLPGGGGKGDGKRRDVDHVETHNAAVKGLQQEEG